VSKDEAAEKIKNLFKDFKENVVYDSIGLDFLEYIYEKSEDPYEYHMLMERIYDKKSPRFYLELENTFAFGYMSSPLKPDEVEHCGECGILKDFAEVDFSETKLNNLFPPRRFCSEDCRKIFSL